MAKKDGDLNLLGLLSFGALFIKAIVLLLSMFNINLGALPLIADIAIAIVVLIIAWTFIKGARKGWRIVYFIILGLVIAGFIVSGIGLHI